MILDLGPASIERIVEQVQQARTVVRNGPLGAAEHEGFEEGMRKVAEAVAERTRAGALTSVVGGGETVAVLGRMGLLDGFTHATLAGGALLEWLQGKDLPGIAVLMSGDQAA